MGLSDLFLICLRLISLILLMYANSAIPHSKSFIDYQNQYVGGKYRCLTYLSLLLTIISLCFGYIKRFWKSKKKIDKIYNILTKLSFGYSFMVTVLYWTIVSINKAFLGGPSEYFGIFPPFLDFCTHTLPFLSMILECLTNDLEKTNIDIYYSIPLFGIFYYTLSYMAASKNNVWGYPFLTDMVHGRAVFYFSITLSGLGLTLLGLTTIYNIKKYFKRNGDSDFLEDKIF